MLGPLVVLGAGGVLVEVLRDRVVALPPIDLARAERLVDRLACRPLLDGVRGAPAADLPAVWSAVVALGQLAVELGDRLAALDVNPVIAGPDGAVAVDVLVVPRTLTGRQLSPPQVTRKEPGAPSVDNHRSRQAVSPAAP